MIEKVTINFFERNYFRDYDELRTDEMVRISEEKLLKAIDKMARRNRSAGLHDALFVTNSDGTGWRLMYDYVDGENELRLRHYTNMRYNSWDTDEAVTVAYAKRTIIGD